MVVKCTKYFLIICLSLIMTTLSGCSDSQAEPEKKVVQEGSMNKKVSMVQERRKDGMSALHGVMLKQITNYAKYKKYTTSLADLKSVIDEDGRIESDKRFYKVAAVECSGKSITECVSLIATPQGEQAEMDKECATLTYNSMGEKGRSGTAKVEECWTVY